VASHFDELVRADGKAGVVQRGAGQPLQNVTGPDESLAFSTYILACSFYVNFFVV
jgi:hypothetical protein